MNWSDKIKILFVEDDVDFSRIFIHKFSSIASFPHEIIHVQNLQSAFHHLKSNSVHVILLDLSLAESQGLQTLQQVQAHAAHLPVIILTGVDDEKLAVDAVQQGAQEYFIKGQFDMRMMVYVIQYSIERKRTEEVLRIRREEQEVIFHAVPAMIWYKDKENRILRANKAAADFIGKSFHEIQGHSFEEIYPDEGRRAYEKDLEVIRTGEAQLRVVERYPRWDKEKRWIQTDRIPYCGENEEIIGVIVFSIDITDRVETELGLRYSEKRLQKQNDVLVKLAKSKTLETGDFKTILREITAAAAETMQVKRVAIWIFEKGRYRIQCSDLFQADEGQHSNGISIAVEKYPAYFEALEKDRVIAVEDVKKDLRTAEFYKSYLFPPTLTSVLNAPVRVRGITVGMICHEHLGDVRHWSGDEQHFAASMADLVALAMEASERKLTEEKLNRLSYYDPLTDLPNRVLFVDRVNQAMITARRYQKNVAVMFLDLDNFKRINDTLGHAIGDDLLRAVAGRLKKTLYETDTLTRVGGDEFTILLSGLEQPNDAVKVADKIFAALKEPFQIAGHDLYMTSSMGIAIFPTDGIDCETLLKNADTAMYQAKEKGKNHYRLYSSSMSVRAFERLILENSLRRALEKGEMEVYYQPIVDIKTNTMIATEALLRWRHPQFGLVGPSEFIPIAEETGLIISLGEWVMRQACLQICEWQRQGFKPIRCSVNLSDRQFNDTDMVSVVKTVIKDTGINPHYLELELTEGMIMKNLEEAVDTLSRLKEMGVHISIDDFGTGHSSLNYIKHLPLDLLKIDRSFISDISTDPEDAAIAKAIISMAHNLKLQVTAEGVETEQQLNILRSYDCDFMQGYYFSKPAPPQAIEKFLTKDKSQSSHQNRKTVA